MKKYTVFSLRVANELVKRGFPFLGTGINIKNPKYQVFYFADSEDLRRTIQELKAEFTPTINV